MSLDLAGLAGELTTALQAAGITAVDHMPQQVHPPVVILEPGDPFITDDRDDVPNGHVAVAYTLHLIARPGTPAAQTENLNALIEAVIGAIPDGWGAGPIVRPYRLRNGDAEWPATNLTLTTITPL